MICKVQRVMVKKNIICLVSWGSFTRHLSTVWPLEVVICSLYMFIAILSNIAVLPIANLENSLADTPITSYTCFTMFLCPCEIKPIQHQQYIYITHRLHVGILTMPHMNLMCVIYLIYIYNKILSSFLIINSKFSQKRICLEFIVKF